MRRDGQRVRLTHQEFKLLRVFADSSGRVLNCDELVAAARTSQPTSGRTVDIHVSRLRRKLGPSGHALIETIRSVGYKCVLSVLELSTDAVGPRVAAVAAQNNTDSFRNLSRMMAGS